MSWQSVADFAEIHKESLGLFGLALAVTMRKQLPWPLNKLDPLEWCYEWLRDGLLTFISMRGPAHAEAAGQQIEKKIVTDAAGASVETVKTTAISGTSTSVPENEKGATQ